MDYLINSDYTIVLLILIFICCVILGFVSLSGYSSSANSSGYSGESFVTQMIKQNLDANKYYVIDDVILPMNDNTTQIDHIVVSEFGVFVIETKNIKGWIYGSSTQKQWTQNLFGYTYKFQNPLHQNYKHLKALQECLNINKTKLISVVVFVGDSVFKSRMPVNITYRESLIRFIQSKTNSIISKEKVSEIINDINSSRLESNFETRRTHIENVRKFHNV